MINNKKHRRWKRAAAYRHKLRGIKRRTFYRLIQQGKLQSDCPTKRTTRICIGYSENEKTVNCLIKPQETAIDCRKCTIPR